MIKKICIILSIVLLAGLMYMIRENNKKASQYSSIISQMNSETSKYSMRIVELNTEVKKLEQEKIALSMGNATTQLIVTDLSTEGGADLINAIERLNYTGIFAVTSKKFPGAKGCISVTRAKELCSRGWTICYMFDEDEAAELDSDQSKAFTAWLKAAKKALSDKELTASTAILFPKGAYKDKFNGTIKKNKLDTVILHGEAEHDLFSAEESDGIWYVGAQSWYETSIPQKQYGTLSISSGNIAIECYNDSSREIDVTGLINTYDSSIRTNFISVTDFDRMKEIQTENRESETDNEDIQALIDEKQAEIDEIQAKIAEIEKEYYEKAETVKRK